MKSSTTFFLTLCLTLLLMLSAATQVFATIDTIIFGGVNPGKNFKPAALTVNIGDTILWKGFFGSADPFHTLLSNTVPPGAAAFGPVDTGKIFIYPVKVAGTYDYQCVIHCCGKVGNMQGTFTAVEADVKDAPANGIVSLEKNFPNPFNGTTTIRYSLKQTSAVTLKIFDINGKEVAALINKSQSAGNYEIPFDGSSLPTGTYIYKLQAGEAVLTKEMVLVRK